MLSLILVFKSSKLNFTLTPVVIAFIADIHNTTSGGTLIADNTNTVELPTILNVISLTHNILKVLYFFPFFNK